MDLRALAYKAGFRGSALNTIVAIAMAESGGRTDARNTNTDGSVDRGVLQFNSRWHPEVKHPDNPALAFKNAYRVTNQGRDFSAWVTYNTGAYKKHLGEESSVPKGNGKGGGNGAAGDGDQNAGISRSDLAMRYGWSLAFLKSDPSLFKLFNQAVKGDWDQTQFVAHLRNTSWFKTKGEAARQSSILKSTDPATWAQQLNTKVAAMRDQATAMGAQVSDKALRAMADHALTLGWGDSQIRDTLSASVKAGAQDTYGGEAAISAARLRDVALNNGVRLSDGTLQQWVQRLAKGEQISGFEQYVRKQAAASFPTYAAELEGGHDLKDLADPYIEQMASTLEINSRDIDLFDPTIRGALQTQNPDTGKVETLPMFAFEKQLRHDPRWRKTNGARDELMGAGLKILQDFGLSG